MKKLILLVSGVLIFVLNVSAKTTLSSLEERVARQPDNARAVYELTREYCRSDSAIKAVESWKRLVALDSNLAAEVFLRAKVAVYLGLEPFFPQRISDTVCEVPRFSQDAKKFVFQKNSGNVFNIGTMDVFGGTSFRWMTNSKLGNYGPCFAGSYDKLFYVNNNDETGEAELVFNNTAGTGEQVVYRNPIRGIESIDWVSDDKPILFSFYSIDSRTWEIGLYDNEAGEFTQLTNNIYTDRYPRYSSDGKYIIFANDRLLDWGIFIMDTKGKIVEEVDPGLGMDILPSFGDHDRKVAFCSDRNGGRQYDIFVYDRKTRDVIPITYNMGQDIYPDFSLDGNWILFSSTRDDASSLPHAYVVSINQPISVEKLMEKINEKEPQGGGSNGNQQP